MKNNSTNGLIEVELLAPARNAETAMSAITHGADAVYIGASSHGARQQAANSLDDIKRVVEYAHRFNARVYATVNTIVYDNELAEVEQMVWDLYRIGVDALIVQDMALLQMHLPPIALHASTQCDIRTPEKAKFLQDAGFSQLVLPRELSATEIRQFSRAVEVPLEAFVHGALCVSYSGDCQASFLTTGRSANRGECAQICRYAFDLEDEEGNKLMRSKHLLSLKDMNRLEFLADMLDAGVSSFKIEGRLKDIGYVKNIVAAYSSALDKIIAANPTRYRRSSRGRCHYTFTPDTHRSFNRGFTSYFIKGHIPSAEALASIGSPKWIGQPVGRVKQVISNRIIEAELDTSLENGDGLGFFNSDNVYCGFRLNRLEVTKLHAASDINPPKDTVLYRNFDKKWDDSLSSDKSARRVITVNMCLSHINGDTLVLEISDTEGIRAIVTKSVVYQSAKSPQTEARMRVLSKLGDTEFELANLTDMLGDMFVQASTLTSLRREAVNALRTTYQSTYRFATRRMAKADLRLPNGYKLSRHDNVANRQAEDFYRSISPLPSTQPIPHAVEVERSATAPIRVMQTRYCLRRELGCCLKGDNAKGLPATLFLTTAATRFRLQFDCASCRMNILLDR